MFPQSKSEVSLDLVLLLCIFFTGPFILSLIRRFYRRCVSRGRIRALLQRKPPGPLLPSVAGDVSVPLQGIKTSDSDAPSASGGSSSTRRPYPTMNLAPPSTPPIPTRPQLHARKYHCSYNGRRHLPFTTWVRGPTVRPAETDLLGGGGGGSGTSEGDDDGLVYEVALFYRRNRACTLYRSWDDFQRLRSGLGPWPGAPPVLGELDVAGLHGFLRAAVAKKAREPAVEYFLRRRMEDCAGG